MTEKYTNTELLTPKQVSNILNIHLGTLATWRMDKNHPLQFIKIGRKVRYKLQDLQNFIDGKIPSKPKLKLNSPKQTTIKQLGLDGRWWDEVWEGDKFISRKQNKEEK